MLCLSPHPDDVEYSMSGTIVKFGKTHFDILCMTQGTSTDVSSNERRLQEVRDFWAQLQVHNVTLLYSEFARFEDAIPAQWITSIERSTLFAKTYDGLCIPSGIDSHYEHGLANSFSHALCRSKPVTILEYKTPSTLHQWTPSLFVNIEKYFEMKKTALRKAFISQLDGPYFDEDLIRSFHLDYLNQKRGQKLSEAFRVVSVFQ